MQSRAKDRRDFPRTPRANMAHLWIEDVPGAWGIWPLFRAQVAPLARVVPPLEGAPRPDASGPVLVGAEPGSPSWLLFASPASGVRVNGVHVSAGLRVLADRDEIRLGNGTTLFFSAEQLARIVPMPATDAPKVCPRCRQPIAIGTPAVSCPNAPCGLWYHQSNEFPCWLYGARCSACEQETALDAGFRWTPEAL
jgi:hypothetical protein